MPALSAATCSGIRRAAAITSPQVSSAVAYDGAPGWTSDVTTTPRRVQASMSMWGQLPRWLISRSFGNRSSSAPEIPVRSRMGTRISASARRAASTSSSWQWSVQMVTSCPASPAKHSRVRTVSR